MVLLKTSFDSQYCIFKTNRSIQFNKYFSCILNTFRLNSFHKYSNESSKRTKFMRCHNLSQNLSLALMKHITES